MISYRTFIESCCKFVAFFLLAQTAKADNPNVVIRNLCVTSTELCSAFWCEAGARDPDLLSMLRTREFELANAREALLTYKESMKQYIDTLRSALNLDANQAATLLREYIDRHLQENGAATNAIPDDGIELAKFHLTSLSNLKAKLVADINEVVGNELATVQEMTNLLRIAEAELSRVIFRLNGVSQSLLSNSPKGGYSRAATLAAKLEADIQSYFGYAAIPNGTMLYKLEVNGWRLWLSTLGAKPNNLTIGFKNLASNSSIELHRNVQLFLENLPKGLVKYNLSSVAPPQKHTGDSFTVEIRDPAYWDAIVYHLVTLAI